MIDVEREFKQKKAKTLKNLNNLCEIIEEVWVKIFIDHCLRLIESIHHRYAAVIRQKGMATKY